MKKVLLCITACVLVLAGCSGRPKDETIVMDNKASLSTGSTEFHIKKVDFQNALGVNYNTIIGWHGSDLVLYDSTGIKLFNYLTALTSPLLSASGGEVQQASLSNNGQQIAYVTSTAKDQLNLSIVDSSSISTTLQVDDKMSAKKMAYFLRPPLIGAVLPEWSNNGKYLLYHTIIDSQSGQDAAVKYDFSSPGILSLYDINDQTNQLLFYRDLGNRSEMCVSSFNMGNILASYSLNGYPVKATFIGSDTVIYLSSNELNIVSISQPKISRQFEGIIGYGVSPDRNYICLVRKDASGSSDIYVGELRDGDIKNETPVYTGFTAFMGKIYFTPDNKKLCLVGSRKETPSVNEVMVLSFQ